jgi:hypothetical protein
MGQFEFWLFVSRSRKFKLTRHGKSLGLAAADEWCVLIIELARNALGAGFCGDEAHFADQIRAPGLIDAAAKLMRQGFELRAPSLGVRRYLETASLACHGARVAREGRSYDGRPSAHEPSERRFRSVEPPGDTSEKFSRAFHEPGDSSTVR